MAPSESILPSEPTNSDSGLSSLSSSPSLSLGIIAPSLTMVGADQEKDTNKVQLDDMQNTGLVSPTITLTHQTQPGDRDQDEEQDEIGESGGEETEREETLIVMPGSLSPSFSTGTSSASASLVSLPRGHGREQAFSPVSPLSHTETDTVSASAITTPRTQGFGTHPSSHARSSTDRELELDSPTATGVEDDAHTDAEVLVRGAPAMTRTSSFESGSPGSSLSSLQLPFPVRLADFRSLSFGLGFGEDALSASSPGGKSTAVSLPPSSSSGFSSRSESTHTPVLKTKTTPKTTTPTAETVYPPCYSAKEKGKARAMDLDQSQAQVSGRGERSSEELRRRDDGEVRLKSSLKKSSRKRYRRVVLEDEDVCVRHGVIHEDGISRDFLLLVALCIGLACAGVLVVRPAVSGALRGGGGDVFADVFGEGFDLFED